MSYFTSIKHVDNLYSFYCNLDRRTSVMQFASNCHVTVNDATGVNTLMFRFAGIMPVGYLDYVCELVRDIAIRANGSTRKIVEDAAVLMLMKKLDLVEVVHVSRAYEPCALTTLWTPEDADALMS